ncbi:translation initiation factor IF-2 [Salmonella enterica]|uniref:Translation initiation factor IF-2 n=1 Tax=Salmonella enterica TaxID=28901 RepID=A0A5U7YJU0_SALER|nr:Gp138 family membrane-puncturing spike protein [Salmonella enterica]EAW1968685.1 translation initiation factor IF-2 [Salmonella enterica subsp. enterica]ECB4833550.1 translation initiation factor IF-2 [Salmonella enterica subsp. enterica serovar Bareilly]ESH68817.1 bacteriophage protein [Salmonella enterica subsp. enterica serovar Bareilly str. 2780]EAA8307092.1 translation initiation factor IF-2 [Salmonella enterica]EAA9166900.1 translation initiation factor IF-2 [Salmonella enterica]
MAVSDQTRSGDLAETFKSERETTKNQIRVALPGIIQSFDPGAVTAVVQPAIRSVETDNDGNRITKNYPLLVDVPVVFPRGGGCTLTFPVKAGDECLVIFADRCIDFWWQNGGVQEPVDDRVHDLSDAFCIVGPQSQAQKISGISTSAAQLRSDDGSTFFELNPSTQKIKIVAPGGLDVVTPLADFSAKVTIYGLLSWLGGMVGSVVSGVASKITGAVEFIGSVKANGKVIDNTHTHGGVQHGGSNTDEVN